MNGVEVDRVGRGWRKSVWEECRGLGQLQYMTGWVDRYEAVTQGTGALDRSIGNRVTVEWGAGAPANAAGADTRRTNCFARETALVKIWP